DDAERAVLLCAPKIIHGLDEAKRVRHLADQLVYMRDAAEPFCRVVRKRGGPSADRGADRRHSTGSVLLNATRIHQHEEWRDHVEDDRFLVETNRLLHGRVCGWRCLNHLRRYLIQRSWYCSWPFGRLFQP